MPLSRVERVPLGEPARVPLVRGSCLPFVSQRVCRLASLHARQLARGKRVPLGTWMHVTLGESARVS